jgi:hypothetical protein
VIPYTAGSQHAQNAFKVQEHFYVKKARLHVARPDYCTYVSNIIRQTTLNIVKNKAIIVEQLVGASCKVVQQQSYYL